LPATQLGRWKKFALENIGNESDSYGYYQLADLKAEIVYIGESRVRQRLLAHWNNVGDKSRVNYYRCIYTGSKDIAERSERKQMKAYKNKHGYLPRYSKR
jgi:hypothetical protein